MPTNPILPPLPEKITLWYRCDPLTSTPKFPKGALDPYTIGKPTLIQPRAKPDQVAPKNYTMEHEKFFQHNENNYRLWLQKPARMHPDNSITLDMDMIDIAQYPMDQIKKGHPAWYFPQLEPTT